MGVDCDAQPVEPDSNWTSTPPGKGEALLFNPAGALLERRVLDASQ